MKRLFLSIVKKEPIYITDNALIKMKQIIQKKNLSSDQDKNIFLFYASSNNFNNFNYNLELMNIKEYNKIYKSDETTIDPILIEKDKIKILIDPMSEILLLGTTIDFNKHLFENKFIFIPEDTLKPSCGISFIPKKNKPI